MISDSVSNSGDGTTRQVVRAAQYVRMSTEHQKYSTENQADIIAQYAERRGFEVVRTYEDSGKTGLRLDGRQSLQQLIFDFRSGAADFKAILVYDITPCCPLQAPADSPYYYFHCR